MIKPSLPTFSEITEAPDAENYYKFRLGSASREVPTLEVDKERIARWLSPPHGFLHVFQKASSPAVATICLIDLYGDQQVFNLWLRWEEKGYGYTLRSELNKHQIEEKEKQWIIQTLKKANLALSLCLAKYPIQPFKPHSSLLK